MAEPKCQNTAECDSLQFQGMFSVEGMNCGSYGHKIYTQMPTYRGRSAIYVTEKQDPMAVIARKNIIIRKKIIYSFIINFKVPDIIYFHEYKTCSRSQLLHTIYPYHIATPDITVLTLLLYMQSEVQSTVCMLVYISIADCKFDLCTDIR